MSNYRADSSRKCLVNVVDGFTSELYDHESILTLFLTYSFKVFEVSKSITDNIAYFLPRNANVEQVFRSFLVSNFLMLDPLDKFDIQFVIET